MKIDQNSKYTLLYADEENIKVFLEKLNNELDNLEKENIIVTFSDNFKRKKEDFLLFLDIAAHKKELGTSFVLVYKDIDADDYPEDFNIVPTLTEAEDILDMEAMERELGF
ncbi:hypothetical protein [Polaribacter dokdonensis]|uniref:Ribonuclease Z n=1 Tax=Polaribacter dokdonensis DSW-5 TaxID=1300348 RepID=A0A0N0CER8_9FLAO|nr:hypothetical protein [Polaribacter dokdonensis]KOY50770.1 Ribonuclease Z [Polaribacter dokdonensis DSW-5]SEE26474.1 hypothetical protein SAMN05444353_1454 [Polaribacter dokdonensis DSW-5]